MRSTALTDGNPLTYDWLNNLVADIETLSNQNAADTGSRIVFKPHWDTSNNTTSKILTGTALVTLGKGSVSGVSSIVKFSSSFASDTDVVVIATVNYNGTDPGVDAYCWVTNTNKDGCIFHARRLDSVDKKKTTSVTINYIAIGKK